MTDRELIRKVHAGNKDALNVIIDKYYDDIYKFCLYLTANELDSYDITQEVFFRFIKYVDAYSHKNLKGYLLIIARNLCRDYFHRKELESSVRLLDDKVHDNDTMGNVESELFVNGILKGIPLEQREVVILRIKEELRFKEIADMLGCNLSTAKSRYRLGIEKLREEMTDYEKR